MAPLASAADYYFSAFGDDAIGDGSIERPWRTVGRFNALDLNPGDSVSFRAGDQFFGRLYLDEGDSGLGRDGRLVAPVRIGSYGAADPGGRAVILAPPNSEGLLAYNSAGLELADLEFTAGAYTGGARTSGLSFYADKSSLSGADKLSHVKVRGVAAHGFSESGLSIYASDRVGYEDVEVVDSEFYENSFAGINVSAARWRDLVHADVLIDRVTAHDNPGYMGSGPHSGHGVLISQVDGGVIQNSVAHGNGKDMGYGNVAIWAWESNNIVIQKNLAYGNRSPAGGDGGAFDLDGGVTNSVVQFNRSYDNDGAGLLLAQFQDADPMVRNVFRYNVSINDGGDHYGGITIWGASSADLATSAVFHNNTIVVDRHAAPDSRGPVWFLGVNHDELVLLNNLFVALNGASLISGDADANQVTIVNNAYWTGGGPIVLEDAAYASVHAWRQASGHEALEGAFAGLTDDPRLIDPIDALPHPFSSMANSGLAPGAEPWPAWLTQLAAHDPNGVPVPQDGAPDIGAYEIMIGDVNFDGRVDAEDLRLLTEAIGGPLATQVRRDMDGDGAVDGAEILAWQRRLMAAAPAGVPEPSVGSFAIGVVVLGTLMRRLRPRCWAPSTNKA